MSVELAKLIDQMNSPRKKAFVKETIADMINTGYDSFRVSQVCYQWSTDTGTPAYEFRKCVDHVIRGH